MTGNRLLGTWEQEAGTSVFLSHREPSSLHGHGGLVAGDVPAITSTNFQFITSLNRSFRITKQLNKSNYKTPNLPHAQFRSLIVMEDDDGLQEGPALLAMSSGMEARFVDLELIGTGSFGDVFRG
jgi:hypothetical protein